MVNVPQVDMDALKKVKLIAEDNGFPKIPEDKWLWPFTREGGLRVYIGYSGVRLPSQHKPVLMNLLSDNEDKDLDWMSVQDNQHIATILCRVYGYAFKDRDGCQRVGVNLYVDQTFLYDFKIPNVLPVELHHDANHWKLHPRPDDEDTDGSPRKRLHIIR